MQDCTLSNSRLLIDHCADRVSCDRMTGQANALIAELSLLRILDASALHAAMRFICLSSVCRPAR
jgi:hypothetical protein